MRKARYRNGSVKATAGYFGLTLANGIAAEMTASAHTSLFRFRFPSTSNETSPLLILDLTDLSDSRQDNGSISVNASTGRMRGDARFLPSFGSGSWVGYFCADFSGAEIRDSGIFVNGRASADVHDLTISRSINSSPLPGGAFVRFKSRPSNGVLARVGLSLISSDRACQHAQDEIPDYGFAATKAAAEEAWRKKMSPISVNVTGSDLSMVTNFYSGVYRTMVNPQNYTRENPLWQSDEPYFDSFYW